MSFAVPGEEEQDEDEIFTSFKKMAKDQQWLQDIGMGHKTWTFGFGHMKNVAEEAGCQGKRTAAFSQPNASVYMLTCFHVCDY